MVFYVNYFSKLLANNKQKTCSFFFKKIGFCNEIDINSNVLSLCSSCDPLNFIFLISDIGIAL